MKGKYSLYVSDTVRSYSLELKSKYTFLLGDSATGKTMLYNMLASGGRAIIKRCELGISTPTTDSDIEASLSGKGRLIVFDEGTDVFIRNTDLANKLIKSDNYFLLITRKSYSAIPYSLRDIYEIVDGSIVQKFSWREEKLSSPDIVITEDIGSGQMMYKNIFQRSIFFPDRRSKYLSLRSGGKSNVVNILSELGLHLDLRSKLIYIIVDCSAFGPEIDSLINQIETSNLWNNVIVFTPESFEYLLLMSINPTMKELHQTWDFCDTRKYNSWEQYYTDLLKRVSWSNNLGQYSKKRLRSQFLKYSEDVKHYLETLG